MSVIENKVPHKLISFLSLCFVATWRYCFLSELCEIRTQCLRNPHTPPGQIYLKPIIEHMSVEGKEAKWKSDIHDSDTNKDRYLVTPRNDTNENPNTEQSHVYTFMYCSL